KPRWDWKPAAEDAELVAFVKQQAEGALSDAYRITAKQERYSRISQIKEALAAAVPQVDGSARWGTQAIAGQVFNLESRIVRERILNGEPRIDGRDHRTVRPINIKTGSLPRTHGSSI